MARSTSTATITNNKNGTVVTLTGSPATITVSPEQTTSYTLTASGVSGSIQAATVAAELMTWLDVQLKRNIVLTFGGGVNEVQRELIAMAGLGLPRAPR